MVALRPEKRHKKGLLAYKDFIKMEEIQAAKKMRKGVPSFRQLLMSV
jgi:hypothetical protein